MEKKYEYWKADTLMRSTWLSLKENPQTGKGKHYEENIHTWSWSDRTQLG